MSDYLSDMCVTIKRAAVPSVIHHGAASCWIARGPVMCPVRSREAQATTAWVVYTNDGTTPTIALLLPSLQLLLNVEDDWTLIEAISLSAWALMLTDCLSDDIAPAVPFIGE